MPNPDAIEGSEAKEERGRGKREKQKQGADAIEGALTLQGVHKEKQQADQPLLAVTTASKKRKVLQSPSRP